MNERTNIIHYSFYADFVILDLNALLTLLHTQADTSIYDYTNFNDYLLIKTVQVRTEMYQRIFYTNFKTFLYPEPP